MTKPTDHSFPPAAAGLPAGTLEAAEIGANRLDAWARTPQGRNFLAHALVQLARTGWLRAEPGERWEPMADRQPIEPAVSSAGQAPATDHTREQIAEAALAAVETALADTLLPDAREEALAGIAAVLPAPVDQAAVLRWAADRYERSDRIVTQMFGHQVAAELRRLADEPDNTQTTTASPATPCGVCDHALKRHRDDVGCTVTGCLCGRYYQPAGARQDGARP